MGKKILLAILFIAVLVPCFSNNSFAEEIVGPWIETSPLPYPLASHVAFSLDNKMYVVGGANFDDYSNVLMAEIQEDGSLSEWSIVSQLPESRYWSSLVRDGSRIYLLGGRQLRENPTAYSGDVYSLEMKEGGLLEWKSLSALPEPLALGGAVIIGDRLYYAGGRTDLKVNEKIYSAIINPDGSIGSWGVVGELPFAMHSFEMQAFHNNILLFGGELAGGERTSKVFASPVNVDGSISSWQELSLLPQALSRFSSSLVIGSKILLIGGFIDGGATDEVYHANIVSDGVVAMWEHNDSKLPYRMGAGTATEKNGNLYLIGGYGQGVGYLDNVYYSRVNVPKEKIISFDSLIDDINHYYEVGEIENGGLYRGLLTHATQSKRLYDLNKKSYRNILESALRILESDTSKKITNSAKEDLRHSITHLLTTL